MAVLLSLMAFSDKVHSRSFFTLDLLMSIAGTCAVAGTWGGRAGGGPDPGALFPLRSAQVFREPGWGLAVGGPDSGALFRSAKSMGP